jgi:ribonuclease BN (tRNA processing enzyme)
MVLVHIAERLRGIEMNPLGTTSVAFVALSALFWGGWVVGSNSPEGQEALANAYTNFKSDQQAEHEASLFADDALRAVVCGGGGGVHDGRGPKPCLAVAAGGKLFIVDAGSGAADALEAKGIPLARLEAVLLTGADQTRAGDLDELWGYAGPQRKNARLPVYGPSDSHRLVQGLNEALGVGPASGFEPWAPAPEPGNNVIVYEGDGLVVSAFTTARDAYTGRVGYRFDYRGRSLVVAGDGHAQWAEAQLDADVVLHGADSESFAQLHEQDRKGGLFPGLAQIAEAAAAANTGTLVLTNASENPILADMQAREARSAGVSDVVTARFGMLLELPLSSREVNVKAL